MTTAAEQTAFPIRDMAGLRASEMARCRRQCAYRHTEPGAQPTDLERRYFARGAMFGKFVAEQLATRYGPGNVEFEKPIAWEHGTAHVDIHVKSEHLFIEVMSTTSPSTLTFAMKVDQVKVYARLYERAGGETPALQVYVVNPSVLTREEAFPVTLTDDDRARIDEWIAQVGRGVNGGDLPPRVCSKPSDGRAHLCSFIDTCFADWAPPTLTAIDDPEVLELAARHHALAEQERVSRKAADSLKAERAKVEAQLADRVQPGEHEAGGYVIVRSARSRESLSLGKARAAGAWTPVHDEVFGPFVTVSSYDVWTTKRQDGDVLALGTMDDYGDTIPF